MPHVRPSALAVLALVVCAWPAAAAAQTSPVATLTGGKITKVTGHEAISQLFSYDLEVTASDLNLALDQIVGKSATFTIATGRTVTGIIESAELAGSNGTDGFYKVRVVPSLARLRYRSSNRTYAAKTVKDIVASVLASAGITSDKISWQLAGSYPVRDITIQYRETDLAFVSRLLEDAGIHYHFDGDLVVFNDGNAGLTALSPSALTYSLTATPSIYSFRRAQAMTSGTVNARDFYFVTPSANLTGTSTGSAFTDLPEGMLPAGAGVTTAARAKARADIRLAARTAAAQGCGGQSSYTHLRAGSKFTLAGHPRAGFNVEYLVTAVDYSGSPAMLRGSFSCLPATVSYRTPPVTPAPVISGVVSAIVVGPSGETKYVDQYGRINVRFPWRLSGDSSVLAPGDAAWVRVVQPAGGMLLPSVGEEVMVAFEHGDPDRPVVIGTVFNAEHMPPVALPANKNRAILTLQ